MARQLIARQGQDEVDTSAKRAISLAEARVSSVVRALDDLATVGVDSCRAEDLALMRRAAFATIPVKEIALLGADGSFCALIVVWRLANARFCLPNP